MSMISYMVLIILLFYVSKFRCEKELYVILSFNIILTSIGMEWLYKALEQYTYITVRSVIFKFIALIFMFFLVHKQTDYVIYGGITIFTTSASNILNFINARKYIYIKKYERYNLKKHIGPIMTFFMSSIIITVYSQFDTVMIGFICGDSDVGIYGAALKIKTVIISVSSGLTAVLIPRMTVYFQENYMKFTKLLEKSLKVSLVVLLPLVSFVFINSNDVLAFLCGSEYLTATPTLRILLVCVLALMFTNLFGNQILIPIGDEKRYTQSVFIGLWINLILNTILIPIYQSFGAALATLVTECFNMIWMARGCKREIKNIKEEVIFSTYIYPLAVALLLEGICIHYVKSFSIFFRLFFNTIVLFGSYYVILAVKKEEIISMGINWCYKAFRRK